jgi:hypothetical protein
MKSYIGTRGPNGCTVTVLDDAHPDESYALNPRFDLRRHSPTGFEFGYSGSGPAQLSLALLADALGDDAQAVRHYQDFKRKVIARIDDDQFSLSQEAIQAFVRQLEAGRGRGA